jgi:hypothetical protein
VESGRRAAKAIDERVQVLEQYQPLWTKSLSKIDDLLFTIKAPQVIDTILISLILLIILYLLM